MNKLILALLLLASTAEAQRRNVVAVYLEHPQATVLQQMTYAESKGAVQGANQLFRGLGMRIQIRKLRYERDPFPHLNTVDYTTRAQRMSALTNWGQHLRGRADAVVYLASPMSRGEIAGTARQICSNKTRLAHSLANVKTGRTTEAIVAIAHEVGHTFGAEHWDIEPNVMHPNALAYIPYSAGWINWVTRGDISYCNRGNK